MRIYFYLLPIFIIEYFLFQRFVFSDIVSFYPTNFDQQSFLMQVYGTVNKISHHGLWYGLTQGQLLPSGVLFPIQLTVFFTLFGATRFNGLLINFIYFIFLQTFFTASVKKISGSNSIALLGLTFLLAVNVPFIIPGGITDLRIDFIAFCLYGMMLTSVIRSNIFLHRGWTFVSAFLAVILILMRTLSSLYIAGIGIILLLYFVILYFREASENRKITLTRIQHLLLFSLIVALITLPIMWMFRVALYNYYVVGHVLGGEKFIRAALVGTTTFWKNIIFYPSALIFHTIGAITVFYALLLLLLLRLTKPKKFKNFSVVLFFSFISFFVPLVILMLDTSKSDVVATIMVTPLLWMLIIFLIKLRVEKWRYFNFLLFLTFCLATVVQLKGYHPKLSAQKKAELAIVENIHLTIGDYAIAHQWPAINLSVDQIDDRFTSGTLTALYFEKKHQFLRVNILPLGGMIFAISKPEAVKSLSKSNVAIFDLSKTPSNPGFPLNVSIDKMKPQLIRYLYTHFHLLRVYQIGDQKIGVFVK